MVDEAPVLLVAGLGNPGRRYQSTWHNLGYMALDFWANRKGFTFQSGRGDYTCLESRSRNGVVTFIKPTSYMNLSGVPISRVSRYRKLIPENILIVCDDAALPLGTIRIRKAGSSGGHNGIESVIAEHGSETIPRMRLGIFVEGWQGTLRNYVLSKIPTELSDDIEKVLSVCSDAFDCILNEGVTRAMNRFNGHHLPEEPEAESS